MKWYDIVVVLYIKTKVPTPYHSHQLKTHNKETKQSTDSSRCDMIRWEREMGGDKVEREEEGRKKVAWYVWMQ